MLNYLFSDLDLACKITLKMTIYTSVSRNSGDWNKEIMKKFFFYLTHKIKVNQLFDIFQNRHIASKTRSFNLNFGTLKVIFS